MVTPREAVAPRLRITLNVGTGWGAPPRFDLGMFQRSHEGRSPERSEGPGGGVETHGEWGGAGGAEGRSPRARALALIGG